MTEALSSNLDHCYLPPPEINHFTHLTPPLLPLMHLTLPPLPLLPPLHPLEKGARTACIILLEEIMEFVFDTWSESDVLSLRGIELFTTHKEQCHRLCESQEGITCSKVDALTSNHEEGGTRMLCHAFHASTNYPNVIIKSPDTDVFFIALNASFVSRPTCTLRPGIKII